jgi:2-iminobutanoate/2-iminopropanoate deaminase
MHSSRRFITQVPGVAESVAPISHAVVVGTHCHVSGPLSVDADGSYVRGSAAAEAERAFANVFAILHAAEFQPSDIVFVDIAFQALADVPALNAIYARLFPEGRRPASTIHQAAALPYGGRVKVQVTAIRDASA